MEVESFDTPKANVQAATLTRLVSLEIVVNATKLKGTALAHLAVIPDIATIFIGVWKVYVLGRS